MEGQEVRVGEAELASKLFGPRDEHLRVLERVLSVRIGARGLTLHLQGEAKDTALAVIVVKALEGLVSAGHVLYPDDVERACGLLRKDPQLKLESIFLETVLTTARGRRVGPRNQAQLRYLEALRKGEISFAIGPAGTGKTYLAMAMAVAALRKGSVQKIILCRPAVEAGERLGFLPGDLQEKVNPYLRPLYDALNEILGSSRCAELLEQGVIEVAPLAFMRGRTLSEAFVVLDEAQNSSGEQMKMFLTRLGKGSRAAVTGDITQIDLPPGIRSGLIEVERILQGVQGVHFCQFSAEDVVRHALVQRIVEAYNRDEVVRRGPAQQSRSDAPNT